MKMLICSLLSLASISACSDYSCTDIGCRWYGVAIRFSPPVPAEGQYKLQIKIPGREYECPFNVPQPRCVDRAGVEGAQVFNSDMHLKMTPTEIELTLLDPAGSVVRNKNFTGIEYEDKRPINACAACDHAELEF